MLIVMVSLLLTVSQLLMGPALLTLFMAGGTMEDMSIKRCVQTQCTFSKTLYTTLGTFQVWFSTGYFDKNYKEKFFIFIIFLDLSTSPYAVYQLWADSDQIWIFYDFLKLLQNRVKDPVL